MIRYTIHYRFYQEYFPMINCCSLNEVANHLDHNNKEDGMAFKIFDNEKDEWVKPELVFLACVMYSGVIN